MTTMIDTATMTDVLGNVQQILPGLREQVDAAERDRTLPAASAQLMLDAGLARILTPRRFGGLELGLETWFDAVRTIAAVDASHGWCASLMVHHPHYVAQYPEEAQREVWANGPDIAISASIAPMCTVEVVEGGYLVSGRSPWCSGIGHSSWAIISGFLPGGRPPEWTFFLLPASDYVVEQTWNTVGMRGTGSNTVVTDKVFVPEHRALKLSALREGRTPGGELQDAAYYRAPWVSYAPATFVTPMLGAAQGALQRFEAWTRERATAGGASVADYTSVQTRLARAAADLDAAELLIRRALRAAEAPTPPDLETRARSMRDYGHSAQLITGAIDSLLAMSGSAAFAESNDVQRVWRDLHLASSHASLNTEMSFAHYGKLHLGLERDPRQQMY